MTKMKITAIVGEGGSAWFDTDDSVREFFSQNGIEETGHLPMNGVVARPAANNEIFLYFIEGEEGARGSRFKLVRADGHRGVVLDSGIITEVFFRARCHNTTQHMFEGRGGRLYRWTFFCQEEGISGNAMDFRFYLGTELSHQPQPSTKG